MRESVNEHIAVIGGGIAGLTAAAGLAAEGIRVSILEKTSTLGGHAACLACKATQTCVKCGACLVEEKIQQCLAHKRVQIYTGVRLESVARGDVLKLGFTALATQTGRQGVAFQEIEPDAVLIATGFKPFDPRSKPYGYGRYPDVLTNLDVERQLRLSGGLTRPSDGKPPQSIAFIQCVGSRDKQLGHLWCSKICCGSALRLAHRIRRQTPQTLVACFYIDVQNYGKDFAVRCREVRDDIEMIRAIPGDIFETDDKRLQVAFFDPQSNRSAEKLFDMVVLSVGLTPGEDNTFLGNLFGWSPAPEGFWTDDPGRPADVFCAGTVFGPMSIAESMTSANQAVWRILAFLSGDRAKTRLETGRPEIKHKMEP